MRFEFKRFDLIEGFSLLFGISAAIADKLGILLLKSLDLLDQEFEEVRSSHTCPTTYLSIQRESELLTLLVYWENAFKSAIFLSIEFTIGR